MALPSSIPTSFVPHTPSGGTKRYNTDFSGASGFFMYAILIITFALAGGVFVYGRILDSQKAAKDAALTQAESSIDVATVQNFVHLRDRLSIGKSLLDNHVALSGFFASIGSIIPVNARFSALHVSFDSSGTAKVEGSGVAKSFNTLAVVSAAFASDPSVKDAIFSKISINPKDNSVSFDLSASLDPKSILYSPDTAAPSAAPATVPAGNASASTTSP